MVSIGDGGIKGILKMYLQIVFGILIMTLVILKELKI